MNTIQPVTYSLGGPTMMMPQQQNPYQDPNNPLLGFQMQQQQNSGSQTGPQLAQALMEMNNSGAFDGAKQSTAYGLNKMGFGNMAYNSLNTPQLSPGVFGGGS